MNNSNVTVKASSTCKTSKEEIGNESIKNSVKLNLYGKYPKGSSWVDYIKSLEEMVDSTDPFERLSALNSLFRCLICTKEEICQPLLDAVLEISTVNGKIDADKAMAWIPSQFRWEMFECLVSEVGLSDKEYNKQLKDAWTSGVGTGRAIPYFMMADPELIMDKRERNALHKMPDIVTLYRGCSKNELNEEEGNTLGISWTTNREVAEFFAFRFGYDENRPRVVVSCEVPKGEILAYFGEPEFECICLGICADDVRIETESPTKYYERYMAKKSKRGN